VCSPKDYLNGKAVRDDLRDMVMHEEVGRLQVALSRAYEKGQPPFDEKFVSEGWELIIGAPREAGLLPVIYHALWVGGAT
jgi:hypothetical protein